MKRIIISLTYLVIIALFSSIAVAEISPTNINTSKLIRYYSMNQNSGSTALDSGVQNVSLTATGTDWINVGSSYAINIDGSDTLKSTTSVTGNIDVSDKASVFFRINLTDTSLGGSEGIQIIEKSGGSYLFFVYRSGVWKFRNNLGGSEYDDSINYTINTGTWYDIGMTYDGSTVKMYVNGLQTAAYAHTGTYPASNNGIDLHGHDGVCGAWCGDYVLRDVAIWNTTVTATDMYTLTYGSNGALNITTINCSSAAPNGDLIPPYETNDTTPTFKFITGVNSNCRIANSNLSYADMTSNRSCSDPEGGTSHICSLWTQDEIGIANITLYIACVNVVNSSNEISAALPMYLELLDNSSTVALQRGIESSNIWPGATVYNNQKVYLRSMNNSQIVATVDKVAVYGNQRWILNHVNETTAQLGLFNISPVVYVLDMKNLTAAQIRGAVSGLINSTKS